MRQWFPALGLLTILLCPAALHAADVPAVRVAVTGIEAAPDTDPRDTWIGTALEEMLARRLRRTGAIAALPTIRLHQGRNELQAKDGPPPAWPQVARGLGATHLLSGTCTGPATGVVLTLRLRDLTDEPGDVKETTLPTGRVFDVLDESTRWTLAQLKIDSLPEDVAQSVFAAPTDSTSALEYYAKSISAARRDNSIEDALRYADAALTSDRRFRPALGLIAQLELQLGRSGRLSARRHLRALVNLARKDNDRLDRANAELAVSLIDQADGNSEAARTRGETALELAREQEDIFAEIAALSWLCDLHVTWAQPATGTPKDDTQTHLKQAATYQATALKLVTAMNDRIGALPAASKLALIHQRLGNAAEALELHQKTRALAEALDSRKHQATAWLYLGRWHGEQEQWDEAVAAMQRCLELADKADHPTVQIALGELYREMGRPADALSAYTAAYEQIHTGTDLMRQYTCLREMAQLERAQGNHREAVSRLQEAVDLAGALQLAERDELRTQLEEWRGESH